MAIAAMNSVWNAKHQKIISVASGSDAATRLHFGTSPFILRTGEEKEARIKPTEVQHSNLGVGDIGGKDVDDMKSVGDQSDTETVWEDYDDNEVFEGDDVSEMGDDDGLDNDAEEGSDDKATRNNEDRYGDGDDDGDEMDMQMTMRITMILIVAPESAVVTPMARILVLSLLFSLCLRRINVFAMRTAASWPRWRQSLWRCCTAPMPRTLLPLKPKLQPWVRL
jgi:hypothetical protein